MRNAFQPGCFFRPEMIKPTRWVLSFLGEAYRSKTFSPQM